MGKPIATLGSIHTCPMVTGLVSHVGGPVSGPCVPGVLVDNQPVAVLGDICVCCGPPDTIVTGSPGVTVDGKPVATVGSMTAHGGIVTVGNPGVTIGSGSMKPATVPLRNIAFPTISIVSSLLRPRKAAEARRQQKEVIETLTAPEDKPKRIYNLQWKREDIVVNESEVEKKVFLTANTWGFEEGEEVTFSIYLPEDEEGTEKEIEQVTGTVRDNYIEIEWEVDKDKIEEIQNEQEKS